MIHLFYSDRMRRLAAPFFVLTTVLSVVWLTYPENLSLWRNISIISAWLGSGLLAASLMLMVREPHIAHLLGGLENMYRWHHRTGVFSYLLLLCHPLALALDNWLEAPPLAWKTLAPWAQSWPVWLGWGALVLLMFGLFTTFIAKLPYRRWRHLHYSLGLGVLLGLAHIYALLGGETLFLLLLVTTTTALAWRFIASDLGMAALPYRVTGLNHPANGVIEIQLKPCASSLQAAPGQFVLTAFDEGLNFKGCGEYHPFTISSIGVDHSLKLCIKSLGTCSQNLQQVEPGVLVRLQGPFGNFLSVDHATPQLWVAGGIGITPFIAALRSKPCTQPTTLLYCFRSERDAIFLNELLVLNRTDPLFELQTQASDHGLPDFPALLKNIHQLTQREVYICGPIPLVNALTPHLRQMGIADNAIHFEKFDFR